MESEVQLCFRMLSLVGAGGNPPLRGEWVLKTETLVSLGFRTLAALYSECRSLGNTEDTDWKREVGETGRGENRHENPKILLSLGATHQGIPGYPRTSELGGTLSGRREGL